jgi:hypothetical protein
MSRPPHPPWLYNSNYTWRRVQIMKLLVIVYIITFNNMKVLKSALKDFLITNFFYSRGIFTSLWKVSAYAHLYILALTVKNHIHPWFSPEKDLWNANKPYYTAMGGWGQSSSLLFLQNYCSRRLTVLFISLWAYSLCLSFQELQPIWLLQLKSRLRVLIVILKPLYFQAHKKKSFFL